MPVRSIVRMALGIFLVIAGSAHFVRSESFAAQVPSWMPWPVATIYVSGLMEIVLGVALIFATRQRRGIGWVTAAFFVIVFPGNLWQWWSQTDGFGLDTDQERFVRLLFQPLLIGWAIWSTKPQPSEVSRSDGIAG